MRAQGEQAIIFHYLYIFKINFKPATCLKWQLFFEVVGCPRLNLNVLGQWYVC